MSGRFSNVNAKQWLVELIQTANNMVPPLKESEVVFSEPNDGSWNINGTDYTALVEMNFKPGGRSDSSIAIPFYYSLIDVVSLFAAMGKEPVFAVAGGHAVSYTVEEVLEKVNALCVNSFIAFKITPADVVISAKQAVTEAAEYGGTPVHTLYSLDFTPSLIFKGTLPVYLGDPLPLTLPNLYNTVALPIDQDNEVSAKICSEYVTLNTATYSDDGFETLASVGGGSYKPAGAVVDYIAAAIRVVKSDMTKVLLEVGSYTLADLGWWVIPAYVYINNKRFNFVSYVDKGAQAGNIPFLYRVTYVEENALPLIAVDGDKVFVHYGDEMLTTSPI